MSEDVKKENEMDDNLKDIIKRINQEQLTEGEIKKLLEESKDSIEFLKKIDEIDLKMDKYVVFTDGKEQLIYEDGEFFIVSSTEVNSKKNKKKRSEAKDMYLEYFIKYQLNPYIKNNEINRVNTINITPKVEVEDRKVKNKEEETLEEKLKRLKEKEKMIRENTKKKDEINRQTKVKKDINNDLVK